MGTIEVKVVFEPVVDEVPLVGFVVVAMVVKLEVTVVELVASTLLVEVSLPQSHPIGQHPDTPLIMTQVEFAAQHPPNGHIIWVGSEQVDWQGTKLPPRLA